MMLPKKKNKKKKINKGIKLKLQEKVIPQQHDGVGRDRHDIELEN